MSKESQDVIVEKNKELVKLLTSPDWKERERGELLFIKEKRDNLFNMLKKYKTGELDFTPNCSFELLVSQLNAMTAYLNILELRATFENF